MLFDVSQTTYSGLYIVNVAVEPVSLNTFVLQGPTEHVGWSEEDRRPVWHIDFDEMDFDGDGR